MTTAWGAKGAGRIVVVTPVFPIPNQPYKGQPIYQAVRSLGKLVDVRVEVPLARYPRWLQPRKFDYRPPDLNFCPPGVAARYFEYPAIPGLTRGLNGHTCARFLKPRLRELSPDVLLNFWLYPEGYGALLAGRELGIPLVAGAIGSDLNAIPDGISRRRTMQTVRMAQHVVTKSAQLKARAVALGADPEKVTVISNGCDGTIFKRGDRGSARAAMKVGASARLILYVGRLEFQKGLAELMRAFAQLAGQDTSVQLCLVGDGPAQEPLKEQVRALGLADRVQFAGAATATEVARWMQAADLVTLPSYAEGCPNVIIEALSSGRPVVASNVGGIPDLVNASCGILAPPRDAEALGGALAEALRRDWNESEIARQFSRSWDAVAAELLAVCEEVAGRQLARKADPTEAAILTTAGNVSA